MAIDRRTIGVFDPFSLDPERLATRPLRDGGWATTMILSSVMSSIDQRRPSRPSPESLTPP